MTFDISDTLAPTSDQLDAIELAGGPRTFQIESVSKNSVEQPINVHFADFPRPWRPSKGMRRVLAMCWGTDASTWSGRRVRLFFDPTVTFGKDTPGGTRIEALSHIDGPKKVPLLVSRGKSAMFTVQPLADEPAPVKTDGIVKAFAALGVTVEQLEGKLSLPVGNWTAGDVALLTKLGKAIKQGDTTVADEFPQPTPGDPAAEAKWAEGAES